MKVYALVEWNHEGAYLCGVFDTYTEARKAFFERLKVNEYDISKGDLQDGDTLCAAYLRMDGHLRYSAAKILNNTLHKSLA